MVHTDLLVDPRRAGIAQIGLQAGPGSNRAAARHIGLDEHPRTVADYAHRLVLLEELAHEAHGVRIRAQGVRVGYSTGEHERVVFGSVSIGGTTLRLNLVSLVEELEHLYLSGTKRDQVDVLPRIADRLQRLRELNLLDAVGKPERHTLAFELVRHRSSLLFVDFSF